VLERLLRKYANVQLEKRLSHVERRLNRAVDQISALNHNYVTLLELERQKGNLP
jgi:hypothetical protein